MADYKLHVRLGEAEFNAEGPESVVREQFALFLDVAKSLGRTQQSNGTGKHDKGDSGNSAKPASGISKPGDDAGAADADAVGRLFATRGHLVSLTALPTTEHQATDALTLLLYGFSTVLKVQPVLGGHLLDAARQSGLNMDRADRYVDNDLVLAAGARRGRRYSLNNRGINKAKELLAAMFE